MLKMEKTNFWLVKKNFVTVYSLEQIHNFVFGAFQLFTYKNNAYWAFFVKQKNQKTFNGGFRQEFHLKMVELVLES